MAGPHETEIIAREYMALGSFKCRWAIQKQLARATASGDWSEMRKWYRVQICVRRIARGEKCLTDVEFARRNQPAPVDGVPPTDWI